MNTEQELLKVASDKVEVNKTYGNDAGIYQAFTQTCNEIGMNPQDKISSMMLNWIKFTKGEYSMNEKKEG